MEAALPVFTAAGSIVRPTSGRNVFVQKIDGVTSVAVDLLHGVLDFVGTVAAVQINELNRFFHSGKFLSLLKYVVSGWLDMAETVKWLFNRFASQYSHHALQSQWILPRYSPLERKTS